MLRRNWQRKQRKSSIDSQIHFPPHIRDTPGRITHSVHTHTPYLFLSLRFTYFLPPPPSIYICPSDSHLVYTLIFFSPPSCSYSPSSSLSFLLCVCLPVSIVSLPFPISSSI